MKIAMKPRTWLKTREHPVENNIIKKTTLCIYEGAASKNQSSGQRKTLISDR